MKALILILTTLSLLACTKRSSGEPRLDSGKAEASDFSESVQITRDEQGIAHIDAKNLKLAMHGLGYVQAKDRLFQMHLRRRWVQGRLSELFGSSENSFLNDKLLTFDKKMRAIGYSRHNQNIYSNLTPRRKEILDSFSEGVNRYLQSLNGQLPSTFSRFGITEIESWKPSDSLDVWSFAGNLFGGTNIQRELDNFEDCKDGTCTPYACGSAKPLDNESAQVPEPTGGLMNWPPIYSFQNPVSGLMKKLRFEMNKYNSPKLAKLVPEKGDLEFKASHAWAIRGNKTTTGKPLLSLDPKIGVYSSTFFYPYKLSVNGFNIRGSGFAGTIGMLAFWNSYLGHAPTSSGGDFVDLLEIEALNDDQYKVGDRVYNFSTRREIVRSKDGSESHFLVKETIFGPVLPHGLFNNHASNKTFVIRHLEHLKTDSHSMFNIFDTMFSKSLSEYVSALDGYVFPSVNLVYAGLDQENGPGDIGYFLGTGIPRRKNLMIDGRDYRGRHPIKVNTEADVWKDRLTLLEAPHVINPERGYQVSANDLVVGDWYYQYAYPGAGGAGNSFRGFQVKNEIKKYMEDDGLISPEEMKTIQLSGKVETVKIFRDMLGELFLNDQLGNSRIDNRTIAVSREEKAQKITLAFNEFLNEGGQLERGTKFNKLVENFLGGPNSIVLKSRGGELSCRFNEAEAGVSRLFREFKEDNSLALDPMVKGFLLLVASDLWDFMMSEGYSQDIGEWNSYPEIEPYKVSQSIIFLCSQLKIPGSANVALCAKDQGVIEEVQLKRYFPNQINASSTSQFTSMVNFSSLNQSVSYIPFGVNEDPNSSFYGANINKWIEMSEGNINAFPLAPLSTSHIDQRNKIVLSIQ